MTEEAFALGLIAGEGCFQLSVRQNPRSEEKTQVRPKFSLLLSEDDSGLVDAFQSVVGVGGTSQTGDGHYQIQVQSKDELRGLCRFIRSSECGLWARSDKHEMFSVWEEIVDVYCDGRTTPEEKLEMIDMAQQMEDRGRGRKTPLRVHKSRIQQRIES